LVSVFADGTPWPMGLVVGLAGVGALLCTRLLKEPTVSLADPSAGNHWWSQGESNP
jgi:hypothetical protein